MTYVTSSASPAFRLNLADARDCTYPFRPRICVRVAVFGRTNAGYIYRTNRIVCFQVISVSSDLLLAISAVAMHGNLNDGS